MNILPPEQRLTRSPDATRALAAEWLSRWPAQDALALALEGDLGSGKTCFVQGLALSMGIRAAVTSPTFTLVNEYLGNGRKLLHADWYRLRDPIEIEGLGLEEALREQAVIAIEWPERVSGWLPADTIRIRFEHGRGPSERIITLNP